MALLNSFSHDPNALRLRGCLLYREGGKNSNCCSAASVAKIEVGVAVAAAAQQNHSRYEKSREREKEGGEAEKSSV